MFDATESVKYYVDVPIACTSSIVVFQEIWWFIILLYMYILLSRSTCDIPFWQDSIVQATNPLMHILISWVVTPKT